MEVVVLSIHLLVCICLIGLVLLQRSEGGALGMGGGGGGALMSGRGAADALAKMTQVAGGFFLVTSLGLTVLSGAGASTAPGIDFSTPARTAPAATPAPATTAPAEQPPETRPDPTQSSAPATTQLTSVVSPPEAAAATPPPAETRAAPLSGTRPAAPPPATTRQAAATPASATTTPPRSAAATSRSAPATTAPAPAAAADRPLLLPNTSGAVSGITLDDEASAPESIEIGNGLEAVRRDQRAGPDQ